MTHGSARRNSLCLLMIGAWRRKKHAFSQLFRHEVFMKDIKQEYKSFIFLSRTRADQFAVKCGYHVYRCCYIHSTKPLQTYERLLSLAVVLKKNCYGQASTCQNSATRKWPIWRILLIYLTSQLTKYTSKPRVGRRLRKTTLPFLTDQGC